jgi:zinc/manganese transport system substrate-binding protein
MKSKIIWSALLAWPVLAWAAPVPVVASFSILGDVVKEVGGDRVAVTTLVGPDQDAHVFQPRPQDVKALAGARLFVVNGLGFEGWMPRMSKAAGYKGATLVASNGIRPLEQDDDGHGHDDHAHGKADPHVWHNPQNVKVWVDNIAAELGRLDPAGQTAYRQRAATYRQKLDELDRQAGARFAAMTPEQRKVVTGHDAFAYLGQRYRIRFLAPQGVSTEAQASARQVAMLIRQIRQEKVQAVFVENIADRRMIDQIARESGARVGGKLYSDALTRSGPASSYLGMMRYNLGELANVMAPVAARP